MLCLSVLLLRQAKGEINVPVALGAFRDKDTIAIQWGMIIISIIFFHGNPGTLPLLLFDFQLPTDILRAQPEKRTGSTRFSSSSKGTRHSVTVQGPYA